MERITNKQIMEKLESLQNDISRNNISNNEIIKKVDATFNTLRNIQNNIIDKQTLKNLSHDSKKSIVMSYAALSIAYLGIGLTVFLSSIKLFALEYSIIFGLFFAGSIILAYLAYLKKKELKQ